MNDEEIKKEKRREYYQRNKEKQLKYATEYAKKNQEKIRQKYRESGFIRQHEYNKKYYKENKEEIRERHLKRDREKAEQKGIEFVTKHPHLSQFLTLIQEPEIKEKKIKGPKRPKREQTERQKAWSIELKKRHEEKRRQRIIEMNRVRDAEEVKEIKITFD